MFTDGVDTSSALNASEVSALASSIDVPVYIVATVSPVDQRARTEGVNRPSEAADLRDLANWTGGRFEFATTFGETVTAADDHRRRDPAAVPAGHRRHRRTRVAAARRAREAALGDCEGAQRVLRRLTTPPLGRPEDGHYTYNSIELMVDAGPVAGQPHPRPPHRAQSARRGPRRPAPKALATREAPARRAGRPRPAPPASEHQLEQRRV